MNQSLLSFWIQVLSHPQRNTEYTSHRLSYNESASKQKDNCSNKVTFTVYLNVISFPFITLSSSHGSSQVILTVQSIVLLLTYIVSALSSSSVFKVR